jgi:transposase
MLGVVQVRYRYRLYPSPEQRQALARVFGCARVVYNDCLRIRDETYAAGDRISDTEVQRQVVTLAKLTTERAWLGEVASVALVQACQDARRAYKNWFDSLKGRRKGPKIRHPRPRRKHGRQSIRLTRNGFALHGERLYLAKVGDVRVEWSRDLPSVPSSVTVIRETDGRYYASFVVERGIAPLLACDRGVKDGPEPLSVRTWTCAACATVHDRDVNAAKNILAAGRADNPNACRADVRPHLVAVGAEAGTHRSAA